jgi:hypothetical protein
MIVFLIQFRLKVEKKGIFSKSKLKYDSNVSDPKAIKNFSLVSYKGEQGEIHHNPRNFADRLNNGSDEDNIINNKKYKEKKCT